tara:strand:- start:821 stop:1030 length:210 start_codon:yes stop_codon:yes gene_type:complete
MTYISPFHKDKTLSSVVSQLKKASKMHLAQAEIVKDHIEDMKESPLNCWKTHKRDYSKPEFSKGSCVKK